MIVIKTDEELSVMREGGRMLSEVMKQTERLVKPGITTKELDRFAENLILKMGAKPNFKGYGGYPATLCTCLNEEIVHCPPSNRSLKEGDILTLDGGLLWKGFHTDMAITVPVGNISRKAEKLLEVTEKSLEVAIGVAKEGNFFGNIGRAIESYLSKEGSFGIIRELCGHGIGKNLHEDPQILNYDSGNLGKKIKKGMVFCIEPMISLGSWQIKEGKDGFSYLTKDNSLAAHFEHMVAITSRGTEVFTRFN